ncbi:MAG: glutathione S-transferase family protein [bacterium]
MITFYALPLSAYCTKVRIVLRIKRVPFDESIPDGGHYSSDAYRRHMPPGSIPAIEEGEFKLFDSEAIVEYLEDVYPEVSMRAVEPKQRARQRALAQFHNTRIEPRVRTLFPIVKGSKEQRDKDVVTEALAAFNAELDKLDNLIQPEPFIGGTHPCLADCGFPATIRMGQDVLEELGSELKLNSKIEDWLAAMESHPVIGEEVNKNRLAVNEWVRQYR